MYIYYPVTPPHHTRETTTGDNNQINNDNQPFDLTAISPRNHSISYSGSIRKKHDSMVDKKYGEKSNVTVQISTISTYKTDQNESNLYKTNRALSTIKEDQFTHKPKWYQFINRSKLPQTSTSKNDIRSYLVEKKEQICNRLKFLKFEFTYKLLVIILSIIFVFFYYALELTFGAFLTVFAYNQINMETPEGAQMTAIYWFSFTFWRLFAVFYIKYTGPKFGILINLAILLVGVSIITPFGYIYKWALYTGSILIGIGISPLWGSLFGFLETCFPVTSKIASSMMLSSAIGEFVFPVIMAQYIQLIPMIFIYVTLSCSLCCILIFLLILFVCKYKLNKSTKTLRISSSH